MKLISYQGMHENFDLIPETLVEDLTWVREKSGIWKTLGLTLIIQTSEDVLIGKKRLS